MAFGDHFGGFEATALHGEGHDEAHGDVAHHAGDDAGVAGVAGAAHFEGVLGDVVAGFADDAFGHAPLLDDFVFGLEWGNGRF